jgi:hypothetical protein
MATSRLWFDDQGVTTTPRDVAPHTDQGCLVIAGQPNRGSPAHDSIMPATLAPASTVPLAPLRGSAVDPTPALHLAPESADHPAVQQLYELHEGAVIDDWAEPEAVRKSSEPGVAVWSAIEAAAAGLMAENVRLSKAQAVDEAMRRDPALYERYCAALDAEQAE